MDSEKEAFYGGAFLTKKWYEMLSLRKWKKKWVGNCRSWVCETLKYKMVTNQQRKSICWRLSQEVFRVSIQVLVDIWNATEKLPQVYKPGIKPSTSLVPIFFFFFYKPVVFFCLFCFSIFLFFAHPPLSSCLSVHCLLYFRFILQTLASSVSWFCNTIQTQQKEGHFGLWPCCCSNSRDLARHWQSTCPSFATTDPRLQHRAPSADGEGRVCQRNLGQAC